MKIGVLGTGMVGQTIGSRLAQLGHDVMMGSRQAANPKAVAWANEEGHHALYGTFANTAGFGKIIFNCVLGMASVDALRAAGEDNLRGKILIDVSNPIDQSSKEFSLTGFKADSLGEQIQRAFPDTLVVKTLNTVNCNVMVDPAKLKEQTDMFVSGNDIEAKATVVAALRDWFGWTSVIDLGDISAARAMEMYVVFWRALRKVVPAQRFNIKVVTS